MTIVDLLILLLIAGVCGAIGQAIGGYSFGGFLVSIVVGFIGAWIGRWIAGELVLPEPFTVQVDDISFPVFWSIIGALVFSLIVGMVSRRRRPYYY